MHKTKTYDICDVTQVTAHSLTSGKYRRGQSLTCLVFERRLLWYSLSNFLTGQSQSKVSSLKGSFRDHWVHPELFGRRWNGCQSSRYTVNSSQPIIVWRVDPPVRQSWDKLTVVCHGSLLYLALATWHGWVLNLLKQ